MKSLVTLLTILCVGFCFFQRGFNYNAIIKNASCNPIANDLIQVNHGCGYVDMSTIQFMSVPHAK